MTNSIVIEQATKMVAQIVDDYERLAQEFLELNLSDLLENHDELKVITVMNLVNIKNHIQVSYMFIEGIKKAAGEVD